MDKSFGYGVVVFVVFGNAESEDLRLVLELVLVVEATNPLGSVCVELNVHHFGGFHDRIMPKLCDIDEFFVKDHD